METDKQRAGDSSGEMNMNDEQKISRRTILNALLGGTTALWFATLLYPVLQYLNPPKVAEPRTSTVKLEGAAQLKNNSSRMFKFGQKPGLLIRTSAGDFKALCRGNPRQGAPGCRHRALSSTFSQKIGRRRTHRPG